MGDYASIDPIISEWVQKHSLHLSTSTRSGRNTRLVYISSESGECFQIHIAHPSDGYVNVHIGYIEGPIPYELEPEKEWCVAVSGLIATLDMVYETVLEWMKRPDLNIPPDF